MSNSNFFEFEIKYQVKLKIKINVPYYEILKIVETRNVDVFFF